MPVTEVLIMPLTAGSDIKDINSPAGKIVKDLVDTLHQQDGFQHVHLGTQIESPDVLQLMIDWDKLESHQKFMNSNGYPPLIKRIGSLLSSAPTIIHVDFATTEGSSAGALITALAAPVTECATFYLPSQSSSFASTAHSFMKTLKDNAPGVLGYAYGWSIEDVEHEGLGEGKKGKAFLLMIGWMSVQAHMDYRDTDAFKNSIDALRKEVKGASMYHVEWWSY
ncbi:hypothetical protein LTR66_003239 [Elasticomyces elasticus]|nr:hypothetical protein LTR28_011206 [Elasticomyces elasticus]KAK4997337.1 hypothetical protein LTR66_003239 [Elasticomyces elasticus]